MPEFILHSTLRGHLCCFRVGAIMNEAAMNFLGRVLFVCLGGLLLLFDEHKYIIASS